MIAAVTLDRRLSAPVRWLVRKLSCGFTVDATTIGHHELFWTQPTPAMRRHEDKHSEQASRYDLAWGPTWLRWLLGDARFLTAYLWEARKGYEANRFEQEAREAEAA